MQAFSHAELSAMGLHLEQVLLERGAADFPKMRLRCGRDRSVIKTVVWSGEGPELTNIGHSRSVVELAAPIRDWGRSVGRKTYICPRKKCSARYTVNSDRLFAAYVRACLEDRDEIVFGSDL